MTSLARTLPIQPLAPSRWRTIERALFDRVSRDLALQEPFGPQSHQCSAPRTSAALAVLATLAAVLALVASWGNDGAAAPSVRVVISDASSPDAGSVYLDIGPQSQLHVTNSPTTAGVARLEQGSAELSVTDRPGQLPFVVQAGDVRLEATRAAVSVSRQRGTTTITVTDGHVQVLHSGANMDLAAGDRWSNHVPGGDSLSRRSSRTRQPGTAAP